MRFSEFCKSLYLIMQIHSIRQGKVDPKQLLPHVINHDLLKDFAITQLQKAKDLLDQLN